MAMQNLMRTTLMSRLLWLSFFLLLGACDSTSDSPRTHYEFQRSINDNFINAPAKLTEQEVRWNPIEQDINSTCPAKQRALQIKANHQSPSTFGISNISTIEFNAIRSSIEAKFSTLNYLIPKSHIDKTFAPIAILSLWQQNRLVAKREVKVQRQHNRIQSTLNDQQLNWVTEFGFDELHYTFCYL